MRVARRFTIKGRVQGVFFRDSTRREAIRLAVTGHALNLPDGDVQVLACGEQAAINELEHWLRQGPPLSRVESVHSEDVAMTELAAGELHEFITA